MTELIFKGNFETNNPEKFIEGLNKLCKDTQTTLRGKVLQFTVEDFASYEEIEEDVNVTQTETDPPNEN